MPLQTLIIGGGLSGLTVASELAHADPNHSFALLEASERTGGVIRTKKRGDYLIDHGADMFATQPASAIDLCQRLGIENELISPLPDHRGAKVYWNRKLHPIPDGFVLMRATRSAPMWKSSLLSPTAKIRWSLERWIKEPAGTRDESVADFVRRRMGSELLDRLVAPLVAGIYTADIETLSFRATMAPIAKMMDEHGSLAAATKHRNRQDHDNVEKNSAGARYENFRSFPGGMQTLVDRIADSIPQDRLRVQSSVQRIEKIESDLEATDGARWKVQVGDQTLESRNLVCAVPPRVIANQLTNVDETLADDIASIRSASTAIVALAVRKKEMILPVDYFGVVVPPKANRNVLAISVASQKFAERCPDDQFLFRVFIGGMLQSELLNQDDSSLTQLAIDELRAIIGLRGEPQMSTVVRWNNAMPQYEIGHLERIERIQSGIAKYPGLYWTHAAAGGVGIAPVIRSARDVALKLTA